MNSREEIKDLFSKYEIKKDITFTNDSDLKKLIDNIEKHVPYERPDAIYEDEKNIYGIEHFQVSEYEKVKKNQDISKIAKGSAENREKMKKDRDFDFNPSIDNLIKAVTMSLETHSKSFTEYKSVLNEKFPNKKYRLVIFIEDSSESAYIVKKKSSDTRCINPLRLSQLSKEFLKYKEDIYGIIYTYGNEVDKILTGCTINELEEKLKSNDLLDAKEYKTAHDKRSVHVSTDEKQDKNKITMTLCDGRI